MMTNWQRRGVMLGLAVALSGGTVWAESPAGGAPAAKKGTAERSARWKEKLGLSDDQVAKLEAAKKARKEALKPLHDQMHQLMEKLQDQVKAKAADNDIQGTLDQIANLHKSMQAENQKFIDSTASFLTPTQRAQMLLGMHHRMKRHMGKGGPNHGSDDGAMTPHPEGDEPGM